MKAILIVDVQVDFLPGGSLAVPRGDEIIPIINQVQKDYDLVVATQDWHPVHHQSFASQHAEHSEFDVIDLNGLEQILWPDHCVQGTIGAEFAPDVNTNNIAAIFRKGMDPSVDSYSAFFDNAKRTDLGLAAYLRHKNVTEVHICGLAADFCVYFSAMDALSEGFKTSIISKATKAIDKGDFMEKKNVFIQQGGTLM